MHGLRLAKSTALPPELCRGRTHPLSERQVVALCAGFGLLGGLLATLGHAPRCTTTAACNRVVGPWLDHGLPLAGAGLAIGLMIGLCLVFAWRVVRRTLIDPLLMRRHGAAAQPLARARDGLTDMRGFELALRAARSRDDRPRHGEREHG